MKRLTTATLIIMALLAVSCTPEQIRNVRILNADISAGLNRATKATIEIAAAEEKQAILPRLSDATILSDRITDCTNAEQAKIRLRGCVTPLLASLKDDIDAASLGIKSETARATLGATLKGLLALVDQIAEVR